MAVTFAVCCIVQSPRHADREAYSTPIINALAARHIEQAVWLAAP
jgi:hypothetical protein